MADSMKALLRPLRHAILASSSDAEEIRQTVEEREVERNLARIKGFTYLKSMDELLTFRPSLEDSLQRSSIPLLARPPVEPDAKAKTMVVHDFGSAYHDYEASNRCIGVGEACFSMGSGEMQFVDSFVYFAHYLVSCPPPTWVNVCHRNGVTVLGTFIIEPQTPKKEVGRILERDGEGSFVVARKLGQIARWIGFDGWMVNIEGCFPDDIWDADLMIYFLKELRGYGIVVWYDALTISNKIIHQNALASPNLPFALVSDSLLTNYAWTPSKISSSISLALEHGLDPSDVYFGIDIWAQNRPRSFWHPRVTWPVFDGGGTNTGFAVAKCAGLGVSAGLFAPGWCWEHFGSVADRRAVEGAMWRGSELGIEATCDCKVGFWGRGDVHRTEKYQDFPIVKKAREKVVGTESGLWSDFEKAVVGHGEELVGVYGGYRMHAQLGAQGVMPVPVKDEENKKIWWEVGDEQPCELSIIAARPSGVDPSQQYLKLYNLGIRVEKDTRLVVRYQVLNSEAAQIETGFLIKFHSSLGESQEYVQLPVGEGLNSPASKTFSHSLAPDPAMGKDAKFIEIGVVVTGDLNEQQEVLKIRELTIGPPSSFQTSEGDLRVTKIDVALGKEEKWNHGRLTWQLEGLPGEKSEWWSERAGPVAYFDVGVNGVVIGRAYGLEFVLPEAVMNRWQDEKTILVELTGVLFGGVRLTKAQALLKLILEGGKWENGEASVVQKEFHSCE